MDMISFREYLSEKLLKGFESPLREYTEIYENPSRDELSAIQTIQFGAILSGPTLYVWDRDLATHENVKYQLTLQTDWLPLYLYLKSGSVKVELALWTMKGTNHTGYNSAAGMADITKRITTNPPIQRLGRVVVKPW